jgi:hypothetical protein
MAAAAAAAATAAARGPPLRFEVVARCRTTKARVGRMTLPHHVVDTPVFMPVGTQGTMKGLTSAQLRAMGCQILLGNTYHLGNRPVRVRRGHIVARPRPADPGSAGPGSCRAGGARRPARLHGLGPQHSHGTARPPTPLCSTHGVTWHAGAGAGRTVAAFRWSRYCSWPTLPRSGDARWRCAVASDRLCLHYIYAHRRVSSFSRPTTAPSSCSRRKSRSSCKTPSVPTLSWHAAARLPRPRCPCAVRVTTLTPSTTGIAIGRRREQSRHRPTHRGGDAPVHPLARPLVRKGRRARLPRAADGCCRPA